jgi:hypothetical protein
LHKGYKCLDIQTKRVYVSHDVVFDEDIFPFANLHPNTAAQLCSELLLLHPTLLPNEGLNLANNHVANAPNLFGENESVQVSTSSLENSEFTGDHASRSTGFKHVTEDLGAQSYGDSPRMAKDQGTGVASDLVLDSLDGATVALSPDPQRSVVHLLRLSRALHQILLAVCARPLTICHNTSGRLCIHNLHQLQFPLFQVQ